MRFSSKAMVCVLAVIAALMVYTGSAYAARILTVGASGNDVSDLQKVLTAKGHYSYQITGYYGNITRDAVVRFQRANSLTADGIAGPQTLNRLYSLQSTLLKIGSSGPQVRQLQEGLKVKGHFNANITGYYGQVTQNSVISFQRAQGLKADGIAGPQTLGRLTTSSGGSTSAQSSSEDVYWLSRLIEAEAGGESYTGKVAVGNVVLNRVNSPEFPKTVKNVIFQYYKGIPMFCPVENGSIYNTPSSESVRAAQASISGSRPAGSATYFFNPTITPINWITKNKTYFLRIGNHAFYG